LTHDKDMPFDVFVVFDTRDQDPQALLRSVILIIVGAKLS
jgi:hypothetical protein